MDEVVKAAVEAYTRGWSPIPLVKGEKRPAHSDWTNTKYFSEAELEQAFEGRNIGLLLGDPSNGLVDIDLDSDIAQRLARWFLTSTSMKHGRPSSPDSHWWYVCPTWSARTVKFADPTDGETLLEVRSTGGQSVIPPSIHPSGEQFRWSGEEWGEPSKTDARDIDQSARWLAAVSLLAKHWPGQGSRHDAALALAGGLITLGDVEGMPTTDYYVELKDDVVDLVKVVAFGGGDEEAEERGRDVETTIKRYKKGKKITGWPTLSNIIDSVVVKQAREWFLEDDGVEESIEDKDNPFNVVHVKDAILHGIEPHPMLVEDIIYDSSLTWLQGEPGKGKTLFALWLATEILNNGGRVMMLDEESGLRMTAQRLYMLGCDPDLAGENLTYCEMPGVNAQDPETRQTFGQLLNESEPDLVIIDSLSDVLSQSGLKENDNDDINLFVKQFLDPMKKAGIAVLIVDHMTKSSLSGMWARGASSKKSKADAAWTFSAIREFNLHTIGRVSLKRAKDRRGQLPNNITFKMGGQDGEKTIVERGRVTENLNIGLDEYQLRIVEYLKENAPTEEEAINFSTLIDDVVGRRTNLLEAADKIQQHIEESPLEIIRRGSSKMWYYAGDTSIDWEGLVDE